ncbi:hypothetical protein RYX36_006303 [Vicia faba]
MNMNSMRVNTALFPFSIVFSFSLYPLIGSLQSTLNLIFSSSARFSKTPSFCHSLYFLFIAFQAKNLS